MILIIGIPGKLMKDKKKDILILGSTGMLGSEVLRIFSEKNNFYRVINGKNYGLL